MTDRVEQLSKIQSEALELSKKMPIMEIHSYLWCCWCYRSYV